MDSRVFYALIVVSIASCSIGLQQAFAQNATRTIVNDIQDLSDTIFTVAIPSVVGLIVAITAAVAAFSKNKKAKEASQAAEAGGQIAITTAQKLAETLQQWAPFITASYNNLPENTRNEIDAYGDKLRTVNVMGRTMSKQLDEIKATVPSKVMDKMDPNKMDLTREQDLISGSSTSRPTSRSTSTDIDRDPIS